jgi:hypothetical protein
VISRPAAPSQRLRSTGLRRLLALALLTVLAGLTIAAPAGADERSTLAPDELRSIASQGAGWLAGTAVDADGAIRTPTGDFDGISTAWAVLAMKSAGLDQEAENPTRWLQENIDVVAREGDRDSAAGLALLILVARAQNLPGEAFGNEDLVARLLALRGPDGLYGGAAPGASDPLGGVPSRQALVLSALGAVGRTDAGAAEWLEERQCPDGGWQFSRTDPSSDCSATPEVTGFALQGLAAAGRAVPPEAITALARIQNSDGGFSLFPGTTDAQATALALQGLIAAGQDPNTDRWRQGRGARAATPFGALTRFSTVSAGFALYAGGPADVPTTARVVVAAAGQPLPLSPTVPTEQAEPESESDETTAVGGSDDSFSLVPLLGLMLVAAAVTGAVYAYRRSRQAL